MREDANSLDEARASRLLEEIADLGQQLDLGRRLRRRGGLRLVLALQLVHGTDHQEQHEGNDDEVDRQREEVAPSQDGALLFRVREICGGDLARKRGEVVREVEAAGGRADDRHDHVADQRCDDGAEGRADDDADREIDDVALHGELAEFPEHPRASFLDRHEQAPRSASVS